MNRLKYWVVLLISLAVAAEASQWVYAFEEVRLKTGTELGFALESATGVNRRRSEIFEYYKINRTQFPASGNLDEISTMFLVSQMNYANYFCRVLVESDRELDPEERWLHPDVDFAGEIEKFSADDYKKTLALYADHFWLRELYAPEEQYLMEMFEIFRDESQRQAVVSLDLLLTATCMTFASSFEFLWQ